MTKQTKRQYPDFKSDIKHWSMLLFTAAGEVGDALKELEKLRVMNERLEQANAHLTELVRRYEKILYHRKYSAVRRRQQAAAAETQKTCAVQGGMS